MNASNGLIRIAKVIRWFAYIIMAGSFVGAISYSEPLIILFCILPSLICIVIAWIIDGFAAKQ
jgi:hypothetical protein